MKKSAAISLSILVLMGCTLAKVDVNIVSERTALENQILGTYNSLDREMLLMTSVRAIDPSGQIREAPEHSQDHDDAIKAIQILEFHADDLNNFKQLKWAGENNQGLIESFEMKTENTPVELSDFANRFTSDEFQTIISQINQSREIIMRRVIVLNENLKEEDLPEIRGIFAKLNFNNAADGELIQHPDGSWYEKE